MNKKRPNCFIAMALGQEQTKAVYRNLICPAVKNLGFEPVIITEVEHNEIIDNMIMSCLNDADIVIADLTFARPSVYYEAGYAERKIPVIYTCRRDHFLSKEDSSRIHFDLEHKSTKLVGIVFIMLTALLLKHSLYLSNHFMQK